ncbi:LacI family transcriptional regulator [Treponema sp. OttesenSCG-928-L16]|nr:LacI family transcriptional regulator [Treponema sp. OttesenSCG-928-L16]
MKQQTVTIRDVAKAAGVSTATVSRVLSAEGSCGVSEKRRDRVRDAAEKLGYRANHAARSLKTRSTRTAAILAPEFSNDFFIEVAEGMERVLDANGYTLIIASSANSQEEEKLRLSALAGRMVDGMAVIPAGRRGGHFQRLADSGMPVVLVDRLTEGAHLDAVLSENEEGAFQLTRALLADGFRKIAFIGGDAAVSAARERQAGYGRAMAEAGRPAVSWLCSGGMGIEDGYRHTDRLLKRGPIPEALVAVNLLVHLGIERRLLDEYKGSRKRISLAVAAFDETAYTPFLPACRYTAVQDAQGIGAAAARRLLERIEQRKQAGKTVSGKTPERPEIIRLPVKIIRH